MRSKKPWYRVNAVEAVVWAGIALFVALSISMAYAHPAAPALRSQITAPVHQFHDAAEGISCSAVMIAPERALTAAHCLIMTAPVLTINGVDYPVTEGYAASPRDLAILFVPGAPCPCAVIAPDPVTEGDWVAAVGYPYGIARVVVYGEMQARVFLDDGMEYLLTTTIGAPGNSGGGLFNERGELVGIVAKGAVGHSLMSVELATLVIQGLK